MAEPRSTRSTRPVLLVVLGLALALLSACGSSSAAPGELRASVVDPPFEVAATTLRTTEGDALALADPGARLSLVFFGYTRCPDVCPLVMSTITSALTRLDDAERAQVQLVFVTTDPARDDPAAIDAYLRGYTPPGVVSRGLRGDLEDTAALAESVGIFVADAEQLASGGFDLGSHGSQVIGVDAAGEAPVFWRQDVSSADLAADLRTLLASSDAG